MKRNKNSFIYFLKKVFNFFAVFTIAAAIVGMFVLKNNSFANSLTLAQISDVHFSTANTNTSYRLLAESKDLLNDAIDQVNETPVDIVVFTGDMINKPFEKELMAFLKHTKRIKHSAWYAVYGNHDICIGGKLTKKRYLNILKDNNPNFDFDKPYYSFSPKKGYWLIGLDTIIDDRLTSNGQIDKEQLAWLDKQLKAHQKDVILIFMHVPIVQPFPSDNHSLLNADEVLKILHKYNNPIAIFSGHYHTTKIIQKENLLFVSTPALVSYPNAFRIVKIVNNKNKATFEITLKETRHKDIQKRAKIMTFNSRIYYGDNHDRTSVYTIHKDKRANTNDK